MAEGAGKEEDKDPTHRHSRHRQGLLELLVAAAETATQARQTPRLRLPTRVRPRPVVAALELVAPPAVMEALLRALTWTFTSRRSLPLRY